MVTNSQTMTTLHDATTNTLPALPAIVDGVVAHRRRGPLRHEFRHRAYQWLVDLDELPHPPWYLRQVAGFDARDHIGGNRPDASRDIKRNVERFLALRDVDLGASGRIVMLANARVFGHVFDPLTVFWCFGTDDTLRCVVAEVHNTYGERHAYLLMPGPHGEAGANKQFYVSPFNDVSGDYAMRFTLTDDHVGVTISLRRDGQTVFDASLHRQTDAGDHGNDRAVRAPPAGNAPARLGADSCPRHPPVAARLADRHPPTTCEPGRSLIMNDDHRLAGRNIWVIGASSGIGAALATELVARGARVAISARRNDELDAVAAGRMTVVTVDVTDRAGVDAAVGQVRDELGEIDMVVYNAGFWERMDASAWDRDLFARHVEINLLGLNNCIGAVLPEMMQAGRGQLVSVASVAGYRGLAGAEAYGATKAAQINLLEALRGAVASRGISVTTVCPGFVRTDLTAKNTFPMPFMIDADTAARSICDGLERGRMEIVFPLPMAVLMKVARLLPVRVWAAISRRMTNR